jgi:hypothetical protein
MIDQTKAVAVRASIEALAAEYDSNGVPDIANTLRKIAALTPAELNRLGNLMSYDMHGVSGISLADLGG